VQTMSNKRITKVQYKGEKLLIKWEIIRNGHKDVKSLESRIEPHFDLVSAIRALDKPICVESELDLKEEEYKRHDIICLNCQYEEDDFGSVEMSASIVSERFMISHEKTMKITSPMKPETGSYCLNSESVEKIYKVLDEADAYLEGKRHDLFAEVV